MKTYLKIIFSIIFFSITFSQIYQVGEQVSIAHQEQEFDICYGAEYHGYDGDDPVFSLGQLNGFTNGGLFYVTMIDLAASW